MSNGNPVPPDPVQAMLAQVQLKNTAFDPASRYRGIDIVTIVANGSTVGYVRRRFLPQQERFKLVQEYTVKDGDRGDLIAASTLGDPLLFWQLCDANNAMNPFELPAPTGRKLRITLPEGVG